MTALTPSPESVLASYTQSLMSRFDEYALRKLLDGKRDLAIREVGSWLGAGSTQMFADYAQTQREIAAFRAKVRPGGLLAGHDCEGRATDTGLMFSAIDYETDHVDSPIPKFHHVHPGVIRAVGEAFGDEVELFADRHHVITLEDGRLGHSTIWFHNASARSHAA